MTAAAPGGHATSAWRPSLGAWLTDEGVRFRVWAPAAAAVTLEVDGGVYAMQRDAEGYHDAFIRGLGAGARYRYRLDGGPPLPDPASRFQPDGVHGPSEVVAPAFPWTDHEWRGIDRGTVVLYELHIGTFTSEGTYRAAAAHLDRLADLGVTVLQVMPVADFPGRWNWGYDNVALFAPSRAYGRPEDLRALVDRAHALGLGVIFDVVYNHLGPDGAYQTAYAPWYLTPEHRTPWGAAVNLDREGSEHVRHYLIESALHWLVEYHADGFRLDAVHMLFDDGKPHFLAEYRDRLDAGRRPGQPPPYLLAEEHRNLPRVVEPRARGGNGFDSLYADDFHHDLHRLLTGEAHAYFGDYAGTTEALAVSLRQGWSFVGQYSPYHGANRGAPAAHVPLPRFVHSLQNHDQVGNRAFGDRLYHEASSAAFRAATAILLFSAATPALFQGDEWATSRPFLFFTDHNEEIGRLTREGRFKEFAGWNDWADERMRHRLPDPQHPGTYLQCRLDWAERDREPHASMVRLHRALLRLRREAPALRWSDTAMQDAGSPRTGTVAVRRTDGGAPPLLLLARLTGGAPVVGDSPLLRAPDGLRWQPVLSTEDPEFAPDPLPVDFVDDGGQDLWCRFRRPGAIVLRAVAPEDSRGEPAP